jgi:PD-(D/E)XK endonuclease
MVKDMRNTQRKGDTAVAQAVATFTRIGYDVSLPLTESAPYDLIVDLGTSLKRIQIKFTTDGKVDLRRVHSNSKGYVVKKPMGGVYDWMYVFRGPTQEEFLVVKPPFGKRSLKMQRNHLLHEVLKHWRDA